MFNKDYCLVDVKRDYGSDFVFKEKGLKRVLVLEAVDGSDGFAFVKLRVSGSLFHLLHPGNYSEF